MCEQRVDISSIGTAKSASPSSDDDRLNASALSQLVGPLGVDAFLGKYFNKKGVHIPGCMLDWQLFGWDQLNSILNYHPGLPENAKILLDGKQTVPKDYLVALRDIRRGSTLFFEDIDRYDPVLSSFLLRLSNELQCPTRFNLYLSSPGKQGRRLHFDTHDVFVVQIEGSKRWTIYDVTSPAPIYLRKNHESDVGENAAPYLDCVLKKGDVLYLPRGHWHNVVPCDEISLHLTLGVFFFTGIEFLVWLADECTEIEAARENAPLRICFDTQEAYVEARRAYMRRIVDALLDRVASERLVEEYEAFCIASLPNRTPFNFPFSIARDELMPTRDVPLKAIDHGAQIMCPAPHASATVVYSNRVLTVPAEIIELARDMLSGRVFCIAEVEHMAPEGSIAQVRSLARVLVSEGLVKPVKELGSTPG